MGVFGGKNFVGVYLDASSLSVLNAQAAGTEAKMLGFAASTGLSSAENDVAKTQQFTEKIKKAFHEAKVHSKSVSLAVPTEGTMIRYFELPALPKKEEKSAVRFEAQKYVPFDMKTLYYDYDRYPDETGKKARIVFFACKKQWVDQVSAMITLAGAKVERVELVSQAMLRAFCQGRKLTGQVEAVILPNDDQRSAELVLFKETSVLFTRHLSFTQGRDSLAIDVPFFISEIRISLDYFFQNFKDEKVAKIHFVSASPEASRLPVHDAVQKELSIPVDTARFPQKVFGNQIVTTGMVAAHGLVLGDLLSDKEKKINLKPAEGSSAVTMTWEEEKKQLQDMATKELIGVAAALVGIYILMSGSVRTKNTELQRAYGNYPPTDTVSIQSPLPDLQVRSAETSERAAFGENLIDKRAFLTLKLSELVKAIPAQVRLVQLRYDDNVNSKGSSDLTLHLEGYATSSESGSDLSVINKLVEQLSQNKDFMAGLDEIKIASTRRVTVKALPATKFVLDCVSVKKVPGAA